MTCSVGFSLNNYLQTDVVCCRTVDGSNPKPWGGCAEVGSTYPYLASISYATAAPGADAVTIACCTKSLLDASAFGTCDQATLAGFPLYLGTTTLSLEIVSY